MPPVPPHPSVVAGDVEEAARRLRDVVPRTPLEPSPRLSALAGREVWLKREDLQPVRSYKLRGAYNLMAQAPGTEAGVVCASAGNHAQGVALACARLGVRGRIYLPSTTPRQKRDRIAALGGDAVEVVIAGATYDDARAASDRHAADSGAVLVPAFDDPRTIAGQGTVALEIAEQLGEAGRELAQVVVPVGGGGLLAGTGAWLGERRPEVGLVGVEPAGAASMAAALAAGEPVTLDAIDPFVDGAAVRRVGASTLPLVAGGGGDLVVLDEGAVCVEMLALYQSDGIIAEPAGALAGGALAAGLVPVPPSRAPASGVCVCVLSGGNNDVSRYGEILERALVHEGLKHYFLVDFPQEPGMLRRFLDEVLGPDDDITLFEYQKRNNRETGPALVGIEIGRREDLEGLRSRMTASPLAIERVDPDSALFRFTL